MLAWLAASNTVTQALVPETVRRGTPDVATLGFIGGFRS
jgi:hypothetical protein